MRVLYFLFLLGFAAVVGIFAYQNNRQDSVVVFGEVKEVSFPILVGAVYLLGMFSGWTVVGMVRRSLQRVTEGERR
jgi:lipopolysaccharide assembly protein A